MPGPIRAMLVDDSAVARGLIQRALDSDPEIEVVSTATDGQMALDMLARTPVDIILLDVEMPGMDGITALPLLVKASPNTRVLMVSVHTLRNAEISFKALALGASDYLTKPTSKDPAETDEFYRQLREKIHALVPPGTRTSHVARSTTPAARVVTPPVVPAPAIPVRQSTTPVPASALAIASSTGGPQALLEVFKHFKGVNVRVPIFITQHMPPTFTTVLAQHISNACGCDCHEAKDGETVKPGVIYLAPGDFHMTAKRNGTEVTLHLDKNPQENFCRPSADPMLRSLSKVYADKLLVTVLTGLGADGARGAGEVVAAGGIVIAQDEATSVVYGMPRAVAESKLTSAVLPLDQIAPYLIKAVS